jgi:uncharacterized membrane protein YdjX (TVP38/TMEM64 family)
VARVGAVALIVAGITGAYWLHAKSGLEWEPRALQAWLSGVGPLAPLVLVGILVFRPFLLIPSGVLLFASGLLLGTVRGTLWGTLGTTLGALLAFGIARVLGRQEIEQRLSGAVAHVDTYLGRRGPAWMAVFTALPTTPLTALHSAAGLSSMRPWRFLLGAVAGLLPRCALFAYFGDALVELEMRQLWTASAILAGALLIGFALRKHWIPRGGPPHDPDGKVG